MTQAQLHATSPFERAPDEVLNEIFMHIATEYPENSDCGLLTWPYGPHPLLPVVQVNKRFNAVASPLLVLNWRLRPTDRNGAKFVLHLLKHPYLRSQVKSLALNVLSFERALQGDDPAPPYNRWPQSYCSTEEVELLVQSAERIYPPLADWRGDDVGLSWTGQIAQRSPGAIAALAVAWATELSTLDLTLDFWASGEPDPWLIRLVKMVVGVLSAPEGLDRDLPSPAMFTKLRCVSLGHWDTEGSMDGRIAAPFFRLPGLRVFRAYAMEAAGLTLDEADPSGSGTAIQPLADQLFPNGTSDVEELHINRSFITDNGIRVLTRACRRLRVFILQWGGSLVSEEESEFSSESIANAISLHADSLEEVWIDCYEDLWVQYCDNADPGSLGDCLVHCNKLKHLAIDLVVLYGLDDYDQNCASQPLSKVLPPSLISLRLAFEPASAGDQVTQENLVDLLRECGPKGRFPSLKNLDLTRCMNETEDYQDLLALAQEAGVDLMLRIRSAGSVVPLHTSTTAGSTTTVGF
ncbi:hypothetical protein J7T55_003408 [Diaporthe amygdali]|uniref:uncharacterized protein n=1 Tax=Phomopsis amygdali TaxID=1214568 RepID=UPI0022FE7E5C|nr:uncharacterized protein J7T55_003408 [Diaporthe amygdali]KAJ0116993.1 hypothetical protein J7T55_003408 [Diaporthe amygdali]